jgi:hypothetical protein
MKAIAGIIALALFSQAGGLGAGKANDVDVNDKTVLTSVDSAKAAALIAHYRWPFKGPWFGGSFTCWAIPGTYREHTFFFEGINKHDDEIEIRLQRHPTVTAAMEDWSKTIDTKKLGLTLFVQQNWGFEVNKTFELGSDKTVRDLKKEMEAFFKNAIPLVNHLTENKPDRA